MSKQKRLEAVNELILKISSLSRRFFYSKKNKRISKFFIIGGRGANVIFIDDYTGASINVRHPKSNWRRFSHGGTMKVLIKSLADHIQTGRKLNWIVCYRFNDTNIWGYEEAGAREIEALAAELRITGPKK